MRIKCQLAKDYSNQEDYIKTNQLAIDALKRLKAKTGKGNDFLGWMDLPKQTSTADIQKIENVAKRLRKYEMVVVVGIGGSYLGPKAVVDLFKPYFEKEETEIVFAGQNLDEEYINELLSYTQKKNYGVIAISKSGTTLEPALALRLLLNQLIEKYSEQEIKERVVAITDKNEGALKDLADAYHMEQFIVPDDVGGRYSVLTAVGLLPIAVAGIDISSLLNSAKESLTELLLENEENPAVLYATYRNLLYQKGFTNEVMIYSKPKWYAFSEWWKQLFGESEGKDHKGIFPISMNITTDLHSLGQYVQEGKRNIFETFIRFVDKETELAVNKSEANYDKLNYLAGKELHFVNSMAELGTMEAHSKGGVPVIEIELKKLDIETVGEMVLFYEISCAISGYVLGVNPFDQPGVEAYKENMFRLLGK